MSNSNLKALIEHARTVTYRSENKFLNVAGFGIYINRQMRDLSRCTFTSSVAVSAEISLRSPENYLFLSSQDTFLGSESQKNENNINLAKEIIVFQSY